MFDGLLGGKFSNKCKHAIKCIGSRLGPIRNKKNAMLRFLRKDVADLLAHGHDENALGRMDALIMEMNRASCYDMIEQCCRCILQWLSVLQKQRECPQEAIESVSTLIFAAARFPDLPELCDLRRVFKDRYGSQAESSVNAEFIEKIQRKSFPLDQKQRVMQEIAKEYSVSWDHKKIANKSDTHTAQPDKIKKGWPAIPNQNDEKIVPNHRSIGLHQEVLFERRSEYSYVDTIHKNDLQNEPNIHVIPSTNNANARAHEPSRRAKKVFTEETENVKPSIFVTRHPPTIDSQNRIHELQVDELANNKSTRDEDIKIDEGQQKQIHVPVQSEARKGSYRVPPYTKSKESTAKLTKDQFFEEEKVPVVGEVPSHYYGSKESDISTPITPNVKARGISKQTIPDLSLPDPNSAFTGKGRSNDGGAKHSHNDGGAKHSHIEKASSMLPPYVKPKVSSKTSFTDPIVDGNGYANGAEDDNPRPRSVRKKHTRIPAANDFDTTGNDPAVILDGRQKQSSKHKQDVEYNTQKAVNQEIDNAIYYGKLLKETPDAGKRRHRDGRRAANYDGSDEEEMMDKLLIQYSKKEKPRNPPGRVVSLPLEQVSPVKAVKGPARAASMEPDLFSSKIGRVHPNLPDCDELAARISALRKA